MRCNCGAEMMVVNAECLVSLSVGHVPKFPVDSLCRRVPKRLRRSAVSCYRSFAILRQRIAARTRITFRDDPRLIKLSDLGLRVKEKFLYEYDFNDQWRHLIRVEAILPSESDRRYPVCIGGKRAAPPEDCGGPWAFMERRDDVHCEVWERFWRLKESVDAGDLDAVQEQMESLESIREWLTLDRLDRRAINRRLKQDVEKDRRRQRT
jgi:hypothetical protein